MRIIRRGIDFSQGHCFGPRPCLNGSPDVFIEGISVVRAGIDDYSQSHNCSDSSHGMGIALTGSPSIFINGFPMHRAGDLVSCGDHAGNGSLSVFANEKK